MGVWQDVKQCIDHWYFQWELASMLYVMDPGEKIAFRILFRREINYFSSWVFSLPVGFFVHVS